MGANPTLRTLSDIDRLGGLLRVTCPRCGRTALYDAKVVETYFYSKGLNTALEVAGSYFRCDGGLNGEEGCGQRGARLSMEPKPVAPEIPKPRPTELQLRQEARRRR